MKFKKNFLVFAITLSIVIHFIGVAATPAFAHSAILDVDYDDCTEHDGDGIDEMWYALQNDDYSMHYTHQATTITYRLVDDPAAGFSWTPAGKSNLLGEEIKTACVASMKKWNNVYFYSYNADGTITKNQIINIVEVTQGEANINIYPATSDVLGDAAGYTFPVGTAWVIENGTPTHYHAPTWDIWINIDAFYVDSPFASQFQLSSADIATIKEKTGAHELGHILGLLDLDNDNICNADASDLHHHEALMGYGDPIYQQSADITYKDIAGAAITRGFHTDNDHKWLNCGLQSNGKYKLICSICNGVKNVVSLSGYTYKTYGACGSNHTLSGGNMMAVASYGTKDYYKCEYCRYVAPFNSNATQNYSKTYHNSSLHKCVNNVIGLEYTFYEEHVRDTYVYVDNKYHRRSCSCGTGTQLEQHVVSSSTIAGGSFFATCMGCGYLIDLRDDYVNDIMSTITQVSVNGSYILPNGIVVLVDEDIQAYLDGTLVFYHPNNVPSTQ